MPKVGIQTLKEGEGEDLGLKEVTEQGGWSGLSGGSTDMEGTEGHGRVELGEFETDLTSEEFTSDEFLILEGPRELSGG